APATPPRNRETAAEAPQRFSSSNPTENPPSRNSPPPPCGSSRSASVPAQTGLPGHNYNPPAPFPRNRSSSGEALPPRFEIPASATPPAGAPGSPAQTGAFPAVPSRSCTTSHSRQGSAL